MASRKLVALINGILTEVVEAKMTFVNFTKTNGDPLVVVKEKVEAVEFGNATSSKIKLDDGTLYTVNGSVAAVKAAFDAA